jgi:hypothetical protein
MPAAPGTPPLNAGLKLDLKDQVIFEEFIQ